MRHLDPVWARRLGECHNVFLLFSSRLGCIGSILLSLVITAVLALAFGLIRLH